MKILILGVNGFIGHHLSKRVLESTERVRGAPARTDTNDDVSGVHTDLVDPGRGP